MLKRLVNELHCKLKITTTGPVLVKSGHASVSGPDMTPVRTWRGSQAYSKDGWDVYLPGSSLKGVVRSHVEKICRTLKPGVACNPFIKAKEKATAQGARLICTEFSDVSCSDKLEVREKGRLEINHQVWQRNGEGQLANTLAYADSCPICRLFGSTSFIGRLSIGDAYLSANSQGRVETRDGVGIDRLTGGAANGAKFELETVSSGVSFETDILLRNFECWQVGMLLVAVADMRDQLIRVGSGRSRGLGAVKAELGELTIHTLAPTPNRAPGQVWGLGMFQTSEYGTFADDVLAVSSMPKESTRGLRHIAAFTGDSLTSLETVARDEFLGRLDGWTVAARMQWQNDWQRGGNNG